MKLGYALIARFGLNSAKTTEPDMFDLRLERSRNRENRRVIQSTLFKTQLSHQVA